MKRILEARGLKKTYGARERNLEVLADVNLNLRGGEMVAVVGAIGRGEKHFAAFAGRARHANERYSILSKIKRLKRMMTRRVANYRNRAVGFLWQRHQLLPDFTAAENVAMPLLLRGEAYAKRQMERAASGWRKWACKPGRASRRRTFGRGTAARRRLRARWSPSRRVLLADEPTGDLDEQNAWAVFELLNGCIARTV